MVRNGKTESKRISPVVLTTREVAQMLRMDTSTVRKLVYNRRLAAIQLDFRGHMRFTPAAVQEFLNQNTIKANE